MSAWGVCDEHRDEAFPEGCPGCQAELLALVRAAEWQGRGDPDRYAFACPWCPGTKDEGHTDDCPARRWLE